MFFDQEVIQAELDELPSKDAAKLLAVMEHYRMVGLSNPAPAMIDDYGDGIKRLRHVSGAYQGRTLFFAVDRTKGFERLVVLTVFKKESQSVPKRILERARTRIVAYKNRDKE